MKTLDREHFDSDRKELYGINICKIQVPRNSTASKWLHNNIDKSLLMFDYALDVAMLSRRLIKDVFTVIHYTHQRIKVDDVTLGRQWGVSAEVAEQASKVMTQCGLQYL